MSLDKMNRGELLVYCIKANAEIERLRSELTDYKDAADSEACAYDELLSSHTKCTRCTQTFRPADQRPDGAEVTRCAEPGCGKRFAHDDEGRCWDV